MQLQMTSEDLVPHQTAIVAIERRHAGGLTYQEFVNDYVVKSRPVIIEDAVSEWPALAGWTPEFFKERFGSKIVKVTYGVSQPLGEVMDAVRLSSFERPGPYLHQVIIHRDIPELLPDLTPNNVYGYPQRFASPLMPPHFQRPDGFLKLLIGGPGGKFPLMHYDSDNANALVTEIYGEKEFVLFSPEDTAFVYPHEKNGNTSQIEDLDHPDLARFPLFTKAAQYRGILRPGESAFIPSHWWHTARVVTTSVSVCVNMLHASNWPGFVSECCRAHSGNWAMRRLKRLYLQMAGTVMSIAERSHEKSPDGALSRHLAALCPAPSETLTARSHHNV